MGAKRRRRTSRTIKRQARIQGPLWLSLSVEGIATDPDFRRAVRRLSYSGARWEGASVQRRRPRRRGAPRDFRDRNKPVEATIEIDAYLTEKVPEGLRKRTFKIRSEGDALVRAADMYRRVFEENERLGGEPALANNEDVRKRVTKRSRRAKKRVFLVNRGFEPYVWGHDMSDLVFETIQIKWKDPKHCHVTFGIGS